MANWVEKGINFQVNQARVLRSHRIIQFNEGAFKVAKLGSNLVILVTVGCALLVE